MLIVPFVSPGLGRVLIAAGWSWADGAGNYDIKAPPLRLRQRLTLHRPPRQHQELPGGAGGTAIARWLLCNSHLGERVSSTTLREAGGVSQPRVSQILQSLARLDLIDRTRGSYRLDGIEPLLDAFLDDYAGPGGSEVPAYSVEPPSRFAEKAIELLHETQRSTSFAISADVGPDLLASWRSPTHVIIYLQQTVTLDALGLVEAEGRGDANVLLRLPDDMSLFTTVRTHTIDSMPLPLVDVPQMLWDLLDLGGEDRREAAGRLREWFIQRRQTSSSS